MTIVFVSRGEDGKINLMCGGPQEFADEAIDDGDQEVIDFIASLARPADPVTIVYQVDLWSRVTDEEAEAIMTAMATQPVRVQNIFRSANSYRSDHELWPLLETVATTLFGSGRAAEILAPSNGSEL